MKIYGSKNWKIWGAGISGLILFLIAIFFGTAQFARFNLRKKYPPPGKVISLSDGRGLHVICEGEGSPTVLLESGLNEFSLHWSLLQPLLSRDTRTCAYDRAGFGWSDISDRASTVENQVSDLEEMIRQMANRQPLILIGHSYGSFLVRLYALRNPQFVKAIILLDPASENMADRIDGYEDAISSAVVQFGRLELIASLGLMAMATEEIPKGYLSGISLDFYRATLASGHFFQAASAETNEMIPNIMKMKSIASDNLSNIPVFIISRGKPDPIPGLSETSSKNLEKTWIDLQLDLANRLYAKHLIATKSGHSINLQEPEFVYEVVRVNFLHK